MIAAAPARSDRRRSLLGPVGSIPTHWVERRAKHLLAEIDERSETGAEELLSVSHLTGVTPRSQKNVTMFKAESYVGHKVCHPGDLVINTMWAWMGAIGVSSDHGLVSPSYAVYRPRDSAAYDAGYLDHLLRTREYVGEFTRRSTGIRASRLRLYPDQFLDVPLVCPPLPEQQAIAAYIRHVDGRIASVIRAKRRQLELLQEQRNALLALHVTGATSPERSRQASIIDGVPDVPASWTLSKVKHIARYLNGYAFKPAQWSDSGLPIIRIQNLTDPRAQTNLFDGEIADKFRVRRGDILLSWSASLGVHTWTGGDAWLNQHIFKVTPDEQVVHRHYYVWLARWLLDYMAREAHGSTMQHVTKEKFGALWVYLPPLGEQAEIAQRLDALAVEMDRVATAWRDEVDLSLRLRERLIADAVFGRLPVPATIGSDEEAAESLAGLFAGEEPPEEVEA